MSSGVSVVFVGFGAVARAAWRVGSAALGWDPRDAVAIDPSPDAREAARAEGIEARAAAVSSMNFRELLAPLLSPRSLLVNLAIDVESADLIELARAEGALYIDADVFLWAERFDRGADPTLARARAELLARIPKGGSQPTALVAHGANPGLASHWAMAGLLSLGREYGLIEDAPHARAGWARLAAQLGVRVVQIAERDHGVHSDRQGVFCNTWSVQGLAREAMQPGELGWGSHEAAPPPGALLEFSPGARSCALPRPGHSCRVKSWTPLGGHGNAWAITHLESIGLRAALFDRATGYAPTCYYAYQPSAPAARGLDALARGAWSMGGPQWVAEGGQVEGVDELGVLLLGERFGSLWIGSRLDSATARALAPGCSATVLQVAAGLVAGAGWIQDNPSLGLLEPEDLSSWEILKRARPWIGPDFEVRSPMVEPLDAPAESLREDDMRFSRFLLD